MQPYTSIGRMEAEPPVDAALTASPQSTLIRQTISGGREIGPSIGRIVHYPSRSLHVLSLSGQMEIPREQASSQRWRITVNTPQMEYNVAVKC
jgi:hypothetical protein